MMGQRKHEQEQFFLYFALLTPCRRITRCASLPRFLIYVGIRRAGELLPQDRSPFVALTR